MQSVVTNLVMNGRISYSGPQGDPVSLSAAKIVTLKPFSTFMETEDLPDAKKINQDLVMGGAFPVAINDYFQWFSLLRS